ncbi:hypothetical protein CLOM_g16520 [Closterium sp. NIES-68]|nr:hypothetical protein CLOM_g16520 [Closterium sp. NIES-68]GJP70886.1 hypothetical protein CLOP_g1778 [Closterium sp. NIES-67]
MALPAEGPKAGVDHPEKEVQFLTSDPIDIGKPASDAALTESHLMLVKAFYHAEKPALPAPSAGTCDDLACFDWCPSSPTSALTHSLPSLFPPSSPHGCFSDFEGDMVTETRVPDAALGNEPLWRANAGELLLSQRNLTPPEAARVSETTTNSLASRKRRFSGTTDSVSSFICCDGERALPHGDAAPAHCRTIQGAAPESCGACMECTEGGTPPPLSAACTRRADDVEHANPVAHPPNSRGTSVATIAMLPSVPIIGSSTNCRPRPLPASMRLTMADIKRVIGLKTAPPTKKPRRGEATLPVQPGKPCSADTHAQSSHHAPPHLPHRTRTSLPRSHRSASIPVPLIRTQHEPSRCLPGVAAMPSHNIRAPHMSPTASPQTPSPLAAEPAVVPCHYDEVETNGHSCSPCDCPLPDSMPPASFLPSLAAASPVSATEAVAGPHWARFGARSGGSSSSLDLRPVPPPSSNPLPMAYDERFRHSAPVLPPYPGPFAIHMGVGAGMGLGLQMGAVGLECGSCEEEGCTCGAGKTWDGKEIEPAQIPVPWLSTPGAALSTGVLPWLSMPPCHVQPLQWQQNQRLEQQAVDAYPLPLPSMSSALPWDLNVHAGVAGYSMERVVWQDKEHGAAEFTHPTVLSLDSMAARGQETRGGEGLQHRATEHDTAAKGDRASSDDEKEVKRKESNRESARRSRVRRQEMMDRLNGEARQLQQTNRSISEQASKAEEELKALKAVQQRLKDECAEVRKQLDAAGINQDEAWTSVC